MEKVKNQAGFTLIELIVVIAILGILSVVAVPKLTSFQNSAKKQVDVVNARRIAESLEYARLEEKITISDGKIDGVDYSKAVNLGDGIKSILTTNYLNSYPTCSYNPGEFLIKVEGDRIKIYCGSNEVYPVPEGDYK